MNINIGDLILLGNNNGHPTIAGIATSFATVGAASNGELKDEDYVYLNEEDSPWAVWEIKQDLYAHIKVDDVKALNLLTH